VCVVNGLGDGECGEPVRVVLFDNNTMAAVCIAVGVTAGVLFAAHTIRDPGALG
jgi:hypothetical protein